MQMIVKFICCSAYDFIDPNTGERVQGVSCKCFDTDNKSIIKVKTDKMVDYEFGDDVLVNVVPNGRYINYQIAE